MDGDVLAYRAAIFNEVALEVEPGYWTWHCDFNKVKKDIQDQLQYLLEALSADDYILCLTDYDRNFRKDVLDTYKGNRANLKKPLVLKPTREWLLELGARIMPGLEGDDVLGILATTPSDDEFIIYSIDKDMKTIPGLYCESLEKGVITITEEEANYWHFFQTLVGDPIDGYSGCPGAGKVGAKAILDKDPSWSSVVTAFKKKGLDEDYALRQARCARILRYEDYNHETGEPILWNPLTN